MKIEADTPEAYIAQLPEDRKRAMTKLRQTILENLPEGFKEEMNYGMIGYVVPHSMYPAGYHVDPKQPLPFINLGSQKHHIALYHSGVYAKPEIHDWFVDAYPRHAKTKPDMGKSCIRFKNVEDIPYDLIAELTRKISPREWIDIYESNVKNR